MLPEAEFVNTRFQRLDSIVLVSLSKGWTGLYSFPRTGLVDTHFKRLDLLMHVFQGYPHMSLKGIYLKRISSKPKVRQDNYKTNWDFTYMGETIIRQYIRTKASSKLKIKASPKARKNM